MASTSPPLSVEERFGLLFIVEASSLSASAVLVLLSYLVYSASTIRKGAHQRWRIESPLHYYFLNLMLCDLIQSAGGMLSIRWIVEAVSTHCPYCTIWLGLLELISWTYSIQRVTEGPFCTAQGIMKHVGDVGTALSTLTITVYTFIVLAFRWKPYRRPRSYLVAVVIVWIFIILAVAINIGVNGANRFYGNTGSWCWIAAEYHVQRLVLDYVWMWTAAFFSIVLYVPLYFILRGSFVLEGWALRIPEETKTETLPRSRLALKMLLWVSSSEAAHSITRAEQYVL
ncbi:hypothetical protein HETIRDRAFT_431723 [Heterobasidion irregulare TC 32-1]|uniref:Uncharacterized protein n=1 Tax=Heterobasidion irregulare (strain TC 32-1) TaxID=747525 RepID=W4KPQ4_HETIT|nr:uncharacterized protein HETIRDRAFT_431723 [Heterobasidion irregulare TC 32-1]ETW87365.1 hypothetical protein HETIRDRAFT_431723 [Heterobasidion irregulare TC 32-1]